MLIWFDSFVLLLFLFGLNSLDLVCFDLIWSDLIWFDVFVVAGLFFFVWCDLA